MNKYLISHIFIGVLVIFLINFSIFYFYAFPKEGLQFLGRRTIEAQSTYGYISLIEQARQKGFLFENLYSSDSTSSFITNPSYFVGGIFAKITGLSSQMVFQMERFLFSILLLVSLYKFLQKSLENEKVRLLSFGVILFFSGFGYLFSKIDSNVPTFLIPQANIFLTLMDAPHFILAVSLLLWGFYFLLGFIENNKGRSLAITAISFFVASLEYPFLSPVILLTVFAMSYFSKVSLNKSILTTVICSLGILIFFLNYIYNPIFKVWENTNVFISPTPLQLLAEYLFLAIPAVFGIEEYLNRKSSWGNLILSWTFINLILLFAPTPLQVKFLQGFIIPLSILSAVGVFKILDLMKRRLKYIIFVIWLMGIIIPSIYIIVLDFKTINSDSNKSYYYFVSNAEYDGMSWLKNNTGENDIIMSNWFFGNLIPAVSSKKVFIGHQILTTNFDNKVSQINSFLLEKDPTIGASFLNLNKINYIFLGNNDSMIQYGFNPKQRSYLERVYSKNEVEIYKYIPVKTSNHLFMLNLPESNPK